MMKSLSMGFPSRQRLLRLLRVWFAGTAIALAHDLPVQRFSSCLLALTLYLLVLDGQRLLGFFVFNQPVNARPRPAALIRPGWLRAGAKAGWVALALGYSFLVIVVGDSKATPIAGAWTVEPSGTKPAIRWHTVYFERGFHGSCPGSIRRDAGVKPETFRYEFDAASKHLRMTFLNTTSPEKSFDGGYEVEDGGRLRLRGVLDEQIDT